MIYRLDLIDRETQVNQFPKIFFCFSNKSEHQGGVFENIWSTVHVHMYFPAI